MENTTQHTPPVYDDEIDLFELAEVIWQKKLLIVVSTILFGAIAAIYAYVIATPLYQAEITIKPPASKDIVWYNKGAYISEELPKYKTAEIFQVVLDNLNSDSLRYEFFKENYLPRLNEEQLNRGEEALYRGFEETLSVKRLNAKDFPHDYTLSFSFFDASIAAQLRDELLQKVLQASKEEISSDVRSQARALANALKLEIEKLRRQAEAQRLDEIEQLSEALTVAQAVNLEQPSFTSGKYNHLNAPYNDGNPLYLQGSKALEAQIKALQERKNNDAHIPEFREIESQWQKIDELAIDDSEAKVARYVGDALVPERPVKPRKLIILLIGLMLGGGIGVVWVLLGHAIAERKKANS